MALAAIRVMIGSSLGGGAYNSSIKGISRPDMTTIATHAATLIADNPAVTPVESAVATLETDGATPTQAHVTALRGVWDTLSAAVTTHNGDANTVNADVLALTGTLGGDVVVMWDGAQITTKNQLRFALQKAMLGVEGSNLLT